MASTNSIVCRVDELTVTLAPTLETASLSLSNGFPPYGLTLRPATFGLSNKDPFNSPLDEHPVIDEILPGSCAFQTGVLQEGDRILSINHESTLDKSLRYLHERYLTGRLDAEDSASNRGKPCPILLKVEYTISDSVIPDSGIFNVKLCKQFNSLGINLQGISMPYLWCYLVASMTGQPKKPLLISKVIPGSVASRSGSIKPGDLLIAVNGFPLESCTLPEAVNLLQVDNPVVVLRLQKGPANPLAANLKLNSTNVSQPTKSKSSNKDWSKLEGE
ncbi:hypothetical protein Ciccas_007713 [Cichlidogyrus casuarinus]|uniref:PDZ domain-containing protein n=1 Tax=Cichlidogyrus casuarinus TaxID=1844966 RepID=A0ABD2Q253_9PLAT